MNDVPAWLANLLLVGLAGARFGFAMVLIPLFSPDMVPPLVRNSLIITFGGVAFVMQPPFAATDFTAAIWAQLLFKELFVGLMIGFFFGAILWAMEAAGEIIDAKTGATIGQIVDPGSGGQTSLTGAFMARLAHVVFVTAGGLMLFVGTIMESFAVWPMTRAWPHFDQGGLTIVESEFGRLMALSFLFAAPVITLLYVIDASLGLLNRFAQQLNVFSLSLSIKSFAAGAFLILLVPLFAQSVIGDLAERPGMVQAMLRAMTR